MSAQTMAVREILTSDNPELRRVAKPVLAGFEQEPEFQQLVQDMRETLEDSGGIGLAATQIGELHRIVLFNVGTSDLRLEENVEPFTDTVCINPVLGLVDSEIQGYWEGCLSVPGKIGFVERPRGVVLRYVDELGKSQERILEGFLATVCQHEMDHLDGILYIDRISDSEQLVDLESADLEDQRTD